PYDSFGRNGLLFCRDESWVYGSLCPSDLGGYHFVCRRERPDSRGKPPRRNQSNGFSIGLWRRRVVFRYARLAPLPLRAVIPKSDFVKNSKASILLRIQFLSLVKCNFAKFATIFLRMRQNRLTLMRIWI